VGGAKQEGEGKGEKRKRKTLESSSDFPMYAQGYTEPHTQMCISHTHTHTHTHRGHDSYQSRALPSGSHPTLIIVMRLNDISINDGPSLRWKFSKVISSGDGYSHLYFAQGKFIK
jgi:hypothetical protein